MDLILLNDGLYSLVKVTKEMYFSNKPLSVFDKDLFNNLHSYLIKYGEDTDKVIAHLAESLKNKLTHETTTKL